MRVWHIRTRFGYDPKIKGISELISDINKLYEIRPILEHKETGVQIDE